MRMLIDKLVCIVCTFTLSFAGMKPFRQLHGVLTLCFAIEAFKETFGKEASAVNSLALCALQFYGAISHSGYCAPRLPRGEYSISLEILGRGPSALRDLSCHRSW
jgi:hypothetical protein